MENEEKDFSAGEKEQEKSSFFFCIELLNLTINRLSRTLPIYNFQTLFHIYVFRLAFDFVSVVLSALSWIFASITYMREFRVFRIFHAFRELAKGIMTKLVCLCEVFFY